MSEIGSAYLVIMPSLKGASASIAQQLGGVNTQSIGSKMGSGLASGVGSTSKAFGAATAALWGAATAVAQKGINAVMSGIDTGVKRFDTMNNFPNVMKNLGIGAKASKAAIAKMSDGLKGLPTALDTAASGVQRLVSKNSDIGKSTDMFLAMNNAILAGGAPVNQQSEAIEQLTQSYSKGKMDMMEWRTLQMAMPAQLGQIAKSMGMSTDKLGEGLRLGKVSMDDFMAKIMELNTKGTGKFASFAEQAKSSTGGIQTKLANVQSAIGRFWQGMFEAAGSDSIGDMFDGVVSGIDGAAKSIGAFAKEIAPTVKEIASSFGDTLLPIMSSAGDAIKTKVLPAIKGLLDFISKNTGMITTFVGAFAGLKIAQAIGSGIMGTAKSVLELGSTIAGAIGKVVAWVAAKWGLAAAETASAGATAASGAAMTGAVPAMLAFGAAAAGIGVALGGLGVAMWGVGQAAEGIGKMMESFGRSVSTVADALIRLSAVDSDKLSSTARSLEEFMLVVAGSGIAGGVGTILDGIGSMFGGTSAFDTVIKAMDAFTRAPDAATMTSKAQGVIDALTLFSGQTFNFPELPVDNINKLENIITVFSNMAAASLGNLWGNTQAIISTLTQFSGVTFNFAELPVDNINNLKNIIETFNNVAAMPINDAILKDNVGKIIESLHLFDEGSTGGFNFSALPVDNINKLKNIIDTFNSLAAMPIDNNNLQLHAQAMIVALHEFDAQNFNFSELPTTQIDRLKNVIDAFNQMAAMPVDGSMQAKAQEVVNTLKVFEGAPQNITLNITLTGLDSLATELYNAGSSLAQTVADGINAKATAAPDALRNILAALGSFSAPSTSYIGTQMVNGIIAGVNSQSGMLSNTMRTLINQAVQAAKDAGEIRSPSRKFKRIIGDNIGMGIAVGIKSTKKKVVDAAKTLVNAIASSMQNLKSVFGLGKDLSPATQAYKDVMNNLTKKQKKYINSIKVTSKAFKGSKTIKAAFQSIEKSIDSVTAKLEEATDKLDDMKQAAQSMRDSVKDAFADFGSISGDEFDFQDAQGYLASLTSKLTQATDFEAAIEKLRDLGLNESAIQDIIGQGLEKGYDSAQGLLQGADAATIAQINAAQASFSKLGEKLGTRLYDDFYKSGINTQQGLVDGLTGDLKKLEAAASKIADALIKAINKKLKIKSPSRVGASTGSFYTLGIVGGLVDEMKAQESELMRAAGLLPKAVAKGIDDNSASITDALDSAMSLTLKPDITPIGSFAIDITNDDAALLAHLEDMTSTIKQIPAMVAREVDRVTSNLTVKMGNREVGRVVKAC